MEREAARARDVTSAPEPVRRVTGLFPSAEKLDGALRELTEASFPQDSIDVLMIDRSGSVDEVRVEQKTRVAAGATVGAAAGAALGLTLVALFPGSALIVGGPLVGALSTTVAGTIGGALNGLGWWRTESDVPTEQLEAGGILVGLAVPAARAEDAAAALRRAGADRVDVV